MRDIHASGNSESRPNSVTIPPPNSLVLEGQGQGVLEFLRTRS
jgi:hypothetical protein